MRHTPNPETLLMSAIFALVAGLLLLSAFPGTAHAYIDPGTAGFLLQAIIGGIVGAMFTLRLYWTRIKKAFGFGVETEETPAESGRTDS